MNFCAIQIIRLDRLDVRHRTRDPIVFYLVKSSRGNILLTKGTDSHVCKGRFATYKDTRFGRTLWSVEISLCR